MIQQDVPVHKNEIIELTFEDLTHEGNGVGKRNGYPIFVPYGLPTERATVKIVKVNKRYAYGKLLKLLKKSPERVTAPCDVYYQCGGCQLQHMSAVLQGEMKRNQVLNVMNKVAGLPDVPVHPILEMEHPWRYRNKIQMPVGEGKDGLITGFYQARSHRIIENMDTCIIQNERGDKMIDKVRKIAEGLGISAYDEKNHQGVLRHIIVRTAFSTGDTMIILVTRTKNLPLEAEFVKLLVEQDSSVKSIIHNVNSERTNVIMGKTSRVIFGEPYIVDTIDDLQFKISAESFYQVNPEQTKVLYEKALEYANVGADNIVIDAFCGIGTISLFLAKKAKKVYGVEVVDGAIQNARENAEINGIENVEFVVGKAEQVMPNWYSEGLRPDVIIVDPPRKGCDLEVLKAMANMNPERIVYVSCNPATLARDLRILEEHGYCTKEVQPVDQFPQTSHVECVALMSRVDE